MADACHNIQLKPADCRKVQGGTSFRMGARCRIMGEWCHSCAPLTTFVVLSSAIQLDATLKPSSPTTVYLCGM